MIDEDRLQAEAVQGKHYQNKYEAIDIIEDVLSRATGLSASQQYCLGNALKYLLRLGHKVNTPWKTDAEKSINYITRMITGGWK